MNMQQSFEAWARNNVGQPSFSGFHSTGGRWVYRHNFIQMTWLCWQAALATQPSASSTAGDPHPLIVIGYVHAAAYNRMERGEADDVRLSRTPPMMGAFPVYARDCRPQHSASSAEAGAVDALVHAMFKPDEDDAPRFTANGEDKAR